MKTGIRLIGIGLILTLININVTSGKTQFNLTPDFIGWIFVSIGCVKLGEYVKRRPQYVGGSILLALSELALFVVDFIYPKKNFSMYQGIVVLLEMLYVTMLLSLLEKIGKKENYDRTDSVRILKYVYVIICFIYAALTFSKEYLPLNLLNILMNI